MEINSSKKKKKKFEDEYKILEELLISKKVKIYKVQSKKDRLTCRMMHSIQKTSFCNLNDDKIMSKEFELLSKLSHPNIIKLFTFYTTDINFNIISEYFKEGTLDTKIRKHKIFTENQAKHVCSQLLNVVKYLNENNLVHTDITPDIIYIQEIVNEKNQELYNIKILQFGSSTINIHNSNNSLYYTSPELLNNKYHKTSDIWSIGIILYQMIYDDLPFKGYKEDEIINNIKKLKVHPPDKAHHTLLSKCLKNLIKRMLNKNPFKRIKVDECLNHEWFTGIPNIDDEDTESVNSKIDLNKEINENKKKEEINTNDKKYKKSNFKTKKEESKKSDISDSDESSENSSDSFSTQKKSEFESNKFSKKKILAISDKNKGKENKIIENKNRNENENKNIINNNKNHEIAKSYSSNMIEVLSSKSNGQKVPPLLIDTIKYIKYYVQINYKRAMEEEKINKIFDKIASKKINKNDNNEIKLTNEDLYLGFLNYIGQKIFNLDSYSDNKKLFINLSNSINENKKNGNAINSSYDKNEFLKTLIILKEKYYEHNLEKSYQQLKKSNTKEIINCFNEIDKKSEYSYFKHYIKEMKSIIMKNKYKEIYLFFEFKNLIINSIKNMYNDTKDNKKKVKINVENDNKSFRRNNSESTKNNGIRGIIKLVDKKGK
jgi:serine/threonine protein kinase